jgi:putative GTP pyrophosphokinase
MDQEAPKRIEEILEEILKEYDLVKGTCDLLAIKLKILLEEMLGDIDVYYVTARAKERSSLRDKILRPEKAYKKLSDITDLIGGRIVTLFSDDVAEVKKIIEQQFDVYESEDKAQILKDDQFGYISHHFIVSVPTTRTQFPEYRAFLGYKMEIQIRSILQHAWAEISHKYKYKYRISIPEKHLIRRRFSRLAGLLEVGDSEIDQIRVLSKSLEEELQRDMKLDKNTIPIDKESLSLFITTSPLVKEIEEHVEELTKLRISFSDEFIEIYVARIFDLAIRNIGEIELGLLQKKELITNFLLSWYASAAGKSTLIPEGVSVSFFLWILILEKGGVDFLSEFLKLHAYNKKRDTNQLAMDLNSAYLAAKAKS